MKYKTLSSIQAQAMSDPEYRAAWEAEEAAGQLSDSVTVSVALCGSHCYHAPHDGIPGSINDKEL